MSHLGRSFVLAAVVLAAGLFPTVRGAGFAPWPHRGIPPVAIQHAPYHNLTPLRLVTIVSHDDDATLNGTLEGYLFSYMDFMLQSSWLQVTSAEFGGGGPVAPPNVHVVGPSFSSIVAADGSTTVPALKKYVTDLISAGSAPAHDGRTVYALFLSSLVKSAGDAFGSASFHPVFQGSGQTYPDSMLVIFRKPDQTTAQAMTGAASHELIEAVTDTMGGYALAADPARSLFDQTTWLEIEGNSHAEVGDLCNGTHITEGGYGFTRSYSNVASATGGDPCLPHVTLNGADVPYFNTTPDLTACGPGPYTVGTEAYRCAESWFRAPAGGGTVDIPINGWSTAPVPGGWSIRVVGTDGTFTPTAGVSQPTIDNGGSAFLRVNVPSGLAPGSWATARVGSSSTTLEGEQDSIHQWVYGVYVPEANEGRTTIPIVLDVDTGSAHFTTDLALTNTGPSSALVTLTYTASLGTKSGSGSVTESIPAGQQVVFPNVLAYLKSKGLPIPPPSTSASQGGTLTVEYDASAGPVNAVARTTAATSSPQPTGSAGLAYGGEVPSEAFTNRAVVYALRSNTTDRSNLAVFNPGTLPVTIRVTAVSGAGDGKSAVVDPGLILAPGVWTQYNGVLQTAGLSNGYVLLDRTSDAGTFGAYGVINDNVTNDGSFVGAVSGGTAGSALALPVLVEAGSFRSELRTANRGTTPAAFTLSYVESLSPSLGAGGTVRINMAPAEQRIIPDAIDFLRKNGASLGAAGAGSGYAGALRVSASGASSDVFVGARTASQSPAGGQYGLFYQALGPNQTAASSASLYGLRADANDRTNVAVVNAGADGTGPVTLQLQVLDGSAAGAPKSPITVTLQPGQWAQPPGFFSSSGVSNGYVRVTRTAGGAPWLAYAVINDGGSPGQRTGDGAFVSMAK